MQLEKYVGKYVDITYPDGEGASGWVASIDETDSGVPLVILDYGFGFPILEESHIKETTPPSNDPGMFKE